MRGEKMRNTNRFQIGNKTENRMNFQRGNFTVEYILLFAAMLGGLVLMFTFIQQSMKGRFRSAVEAFSGGRQFQPSGEHKTVINIIK